MSEEADVHRLNAQVVRLYHAGKYTEAIPLAERALSFAEKTIGTDPVATADSANNLAELYRAEGDYARAEPLYLRAVAINLKVRGQEHRVTATSLDNLAELYRDKGDYERAVPFSQLALDIRKRVLGPGHLETAWSLNNRALLYRAMGDVEQAEPLLRSALCITEKVRGPADPDTARALGSLAELYLQKGEEGDYKRAEPLLRRALAIDEQILGPDHPDTASSVNNLAVLYLNTGDYERAECFLRRALAVNEKALGPEHPTTASALGNLGVLHWAKGERTEAASYLSRSGDARERNVDLVLTSGSEQQKQAYLSTLQADTPIAVSFHTQFAPDDPDALRLALLTVLRRKGRLLEAVTAETSALRQRLNADDQRLLDELMQTRTLHANMVMRGPGARDLTEYEKQIEELRAQEDQVEAAISLRSGAFRAQSHPVTLRAVQATLPENAALVELVYYWPIDPKTFLANKTLAPPRYAAYVLFHDGQPAWTDLGEAEPIERLVLALRAALSSPERTDVKDLARKLDEKIMRPVRKLLCGRKQVLLSPDGQLNLVPFAALVDEGGHYLLERYTFTYLGSGRDLLRLQGRTSSRQGAMVVANPDYNGHFQPLLGTEQEAESIKKLLKLPQEAVLTGTRATKAAVKGLSGPRLLHIATHGFFQPDQQAEAPKASRTWVLPQAQGDWRPFLPSGENPLLRSGLVLAAANGLESGSKDGVMTALEVSGLDLWGTQLVVLSACETGVGDVAYGEGVYGLRRALVLAGSRAQVMSLWKVNDAATRDLMVGFYRRLLKGEALSEALRGVQRKMLASKEQRHPYYWAAFIPSGESRSLGR
jgi:CHAT domain-containing protein/Tfp pilus assembly protein PilF